MAPEMAIGEIPRTHYVFSESGWTNSSIFDSWFKKLFLRYAPASRPLLLFMDGHSSHFCPDTLALAHENVIMIFTLPPNTTHLLQPLDKGVFGPFKVPPSEAMKRCGMYAPFSVQDAQKHRQYIGNTSAIIRLSPARRNIREGVAPRGYV